MNQNPYKKIKDYKITELELLKSINDIEKKDEPFTFWKKIVNDDKYQFFHRKHCMIQLFKRHTYSGIPLSEFIKIVHQLRTFDKQHLEVVEVLAGKIPMKISGDRTVFHWHSSDEINTYAYSIYFSLLGNWTLDLLMSKIEGEEVGKSNNAQILEIGYFDPFNSTD